MREKSFIQAIKKIYLVETKVSWQFFLFVSTKFQVKINPKSKNNETDASCTKCVVGLCYIYYYCKTTFPKVSNQLVNF
jgi:hypothetical protein